MAAKSARRWTNAQIKEQVKKIQAAIEKQKRAVKKGDIFTAITPEEIEKKLKRMNSPIFVTWSSSAVTSPGGTINYIVAIYNPDPLPAGPMFAHVWVGSGNIDPVVGTFLLNVDTRFPRLTEPESPGMYLPSNTIKWLSFALKVPAGVEKTKYMLNTCLMKFSWLDVGEYLDRCVVVFSVI